MAYLALYRKHRPKNFDEIVGQRAVVTALQNQVKYGQIGHAYLFCGTRGTGKTSTAKVFARAVNCLHPINGNPCNECELCKEAESGFNVIEIDAASNKPANLKGEDGKTLEAKLQEVLDKEAKGTKASDLAFAEIFDVVYVVNGKVTPLPSTATIEFEYTAPDGSVLIFIHQVKAGAWKFEATTATVTVDKLSPFAFVTAKKAAAADSKSGDDGKTSPQTGEYVTKSVLAGAAVLAVLGMVCVVRAKKSSKAN